MAPGVVAHLVSLRLHPQKQVLILPDPFSHHKKGGTGTPLLETVQQPVRGALPWAVIKGQGNIFCLRRQLGRRVRLGGFRCLPHTARQ